jgi:hypothetical protein
VTIDEKDCGFKRVEVTAACKKEKSVFGSDTLSVTGSSLPKEQLVAD